MTAVWIGVAAERPEDAWAAAELHDAGGAPDGVLVAWRADRRPVPGAVRCDPRALDPGGRPARAWLLLLDHRVLFDDAAVQRGRRLLLAHGGFDAVTTFSRDASTFGGALCAWRGDGQPDDPFAQVAPARRVTVGPGLIAEGPPLLPGPIVERYAGQPWPADRFPAP
jgi:hypothetical protein